MDEPITDKVRGTLDGHIVLSRKLAHRAHFPAIDVLASISRLAKRVSGPKTQEAVLAMRRKMALYAENEDMITAGAYQSGSSSAIDDAIKSHDAIESFLVQEEFSPSSLAETISTLAKITGVAIPPEEYGENQESAQEGVKPESIN